MKQPKTFKRKMWAIATMIEAGPDDDNLCRRCGDSYLCDPGMDPTPLCHSCAQEVVAMFPALVGMLAPLKPAKRRKRK